MSTTDNDDEAPSKGIELPESARRLHALYAADLGRVEPVSDAQILAAIDRAEVHDQHDDASRADIAAHLGFAHNSWTTKQLRPQIEALRAAGRIRDVRRNGLDLLALTDAGHRIDGFREALRASMAEVGALLDAEQAPSDAWFEFGKRLSAECRRLGSATYCLYEWAEPDDARADVDEVLPTLTRF